MNRRHDIDALRVLAFSLLIFYHLGMVYVANWEFHFKSEHQWTWLQWPMIGVNRWRMPLIFLISGVALGLARSRRSPSILGLHKKLRLLLPLGFGMLAIVPVQAYCEAVANGTIEPGFGAFMARYLQLRPWPEAGFTGANYGITWNHLWYLAYLWVYTIALLCLQYLVKVISLRCPGLSSLSPGNWPIALLLIVPVTYCFVCLYWIEPMFPTTHALLNDWFSHALYFPIFVFGFAVATSDCFWRCIVAQRLLILVLALAGLVLYIGLRLLGRALPGEALQTLPDWNWRAISKGAHALYLWAALFAILAYGHRWLNRPFRWLPRATEAIYPWYILHQSLIVPVAFVLSPIALPAGLEVLLVLVATVVGCAVIHEGVIRHVGVVRVLFGLRYKSAKAEKPVSHRIF